MPDDTPAPTSPPSDSAPAQPPAPAQEPPQRPKLPFNDAIREGGGRPPRPIARETKED